MKKVLMLAIAVLMTVALTACGSGGSNSSGGSDSGSNTSENTSSGSNSGSESSSNSGSESDSGSNSESSSGNHSIFKQIKEDGVVQVGFSDEAPYAYENEQGKLTGAAVEVARAVFKEMGLKMEGKLAEWSNLIPGVKSGKLDVITAGMAVNPKRCKSIDFGHPGIVYGEGIAVQKGNPMDLHSYKDIAQTGATVAVLNSGTEVQFLKKSGVKPSQIMKVSSTAKGFAAVKSGRADVTTATQLTVKATVKKSEGNKLQYVSEFKQPQVPGVPSYGAAGFNKKADAFRKAYNKTLEKLRDKGKIKKAILSLPLWDKTNIYHPKKDPSTKELCAK